MRRAWRVDPAGGPEGPFVFVDEDFVRRSVETAPEVGITMEGDGVDVDCSVGREPVGARGGGYGLWCLGLLGDVDQRSEMSKSLKHESHDADCSRKDGGIIEGFVRRAGKDCVDLFEQPVLLLRVPGQQNESIR